MLESIIVGIMCGLSFLCGVVFNFLYDIIVYKKNLDKYKKQYENHKIIFKNIVNKIKIKVLTKYKNCNIINNIINSCKKL